MAYKLKTRSGCLQGNCYTVRVRDASPFLPAARAVDVQRIVNPPRLRKVGSIPTPPTIRARAEVSR